MKTIDQQIGEVLRDKRTKLGWSQQEVGERIGLSSQQVQKYEKGRNSLTSKRLFEFAAIFGLGADALLREVKKHKPAKLNISNRQYLETMKCLDVLPLQEFKAVNKFIQELSKTRRLQAA